MSNPGHTRPGGLRPQFTTLPDGRQQAITFFKLSSGDQISTDLILPWGGLYSAIEGVKTTGKKAHLAGLRLIGGQEARQMQGGGDWVWVREYEELPATGEVLVGELTRVTDENGRDMLEGVFRSLSGVAEEAVTVGTTTAPGDAGAVLDSQRVEDNGAVRSVTRRYLQASNSLVQVGKNRFAMLEDGRQSIEADFIIRSGASYTPGVVGTTTPPAPDAAAGVMMTETPAPVNQVVRRLSRVYVAAGLLSTSSVDVGDGMKDVTWVSVRTKQSPSFGALRRDDVRNPNGLPVYTVTKRQSASGGDPTGISVSFPRFVPFKYPSRAKPFTEVFNSRTMIDLYQSPGESVLIPATVTISFTTSNAIGTVTPVRWNPSSGAVLRAQWVGLRDEPVNLVKPLPGYRAVGAGSPPTASVEVTAGVLAPVNVSCMGNTVYGGTTARIKVTGGPADPAGNDYTLFIDYDPVFADVSGTQYYRKTVITATIPAEDALPV